jgi:hypothetical protein
MITKSIDTTDLMTIQSQLNEGNWNLNPDWQRDDNVFSQKDKCLLIESILDDYPISSIILIGHKKEKDDDYFIFDVIDGKQRLTTIKEFMSDNLIFKTKNEEYKILNNKKYSQFPPDKKSIVKCFTIPIIKLDGTLNTNIERPEIFKRINVGYKKLNKQEIRDSRGTSMGVCVKNLSEGIRNITKMTERRSKHRMITARCLAISEIEFKSNINYLCDELYNITDVIKINEIKDKGKKTLNLMKNIFPFNLLKYDTEIDAIFVCLYRDIDKYYNKGAILSKNEEVSKKIEELFKSDEWKGCTSGDGHHKVKTEKRINLVEKIFNEYKSDIDLDLNRNFSENQRIELWNTREHKCNICGGIITDITCMDVDHMKRYSEGGKTVLENAALTHSQCNRSNR